MDHVPWHGPRVIQVPYLEGKAWEHGEFASYGEKQGLFEASSEKSPTEKLQIIQTWLFFGLFTEILGLIGIPCDVGDFVESDELGKRITTKKLPTFLVAIQEYEDGQDTGRAERRQSIVSFLRKVVEVAEFYAQYGDEKAGTVDTAFVRETGGPVLLSIWMASFALNEACIGIYGEEFDSSAGVIKNMVGLAFLMNTMRAEGWCQSHITRLGRLGNREFLYLTYSYGPWHLPGSDHSRCNNFCVYNLVDTRTYEPRHEKEDCDCAIIEVDRQKMEAIIESGGIPVCRLYSKVPVGGGPSDLILEVKAASDEHPFIAVSHVWSHGLGNPRQNGLPSCAAARVQNSVAISWHWLLKQGIRHKQDEHGCVHSFWMDTFCVPVHPSSQYLRKKAIAQMKDIYSGAVAVQVIDQELRQRSTRNKLPEMLISIALSPWARRLWTLQEAVLAKRIHVLISDGMVDFDTLVKEYMMLLTSGIGSSNRNFRFYSLIPQSVISFWSSMRPYTPHSAVGTAIEVPPGRTLPLSKTGINSAMVADILGQLPFRSTSRRSDETICMSTLFGMDVMRLLEVEADSDDETCDQRMVKLLSDLSIIPVSLAFSPGPKIAIAGFRWAPKTFLQEPAGELSTTIRGWHAKIVPSKGLVCRVDALVLPRGYSSDNVLANADEFMVFETGYISKGPILIGTPPGEGYHREQVHVTPPDYNDPAPMLVLLFMESFNDRVASVTIMGVVREKSSLEVLGSETKKGDWLLDASKPGTTEIILGGKGGDADTGESRASVVVGNATYTAIRREPAEVWKDEEGEVVVEC